jgi:preprotein translocase subunit YajC
MLSILPVLQAEGFMGENLIYTVIMIGLIVVLFYFLIIRPQNKKQKEMQKMLASLKKNDKVVTIGGIHGTITQVKENTIILKVDDNVTMQFSRSAISSLENVKIDEESKKT